MNAGEGLVGSSVELGGACERVKQLGHEAVKGHQAAHTRPARENTHATIANDRAQGENHCEGTANREPDTAPEQPLLRPDRAGEELACPTFPGPLVPE